jgi:transcriptional regulator with XRE-family HTH domain
MNDKLISWLASELTERGWSQRELSRRANISHTSVTEVMAHRRNPTFDFCAAIAEPLERDPVELFVMAELLPPPVPQRGEQVAAAINERRAGYAMPAAVDRLDAEDVMEVLQKLDNLELQQVYDYARWRLMEQETRRDSSGRRRPSVDSIEQAMRTFSSEERFQILRRLTEVMDDSNKSK